MTAELSLDDVRAELSAGSRVLLLVRHSERPKIDFDDKTFGAELPLTAHGAELCLEYGRMLAGASDDVRFRASPLRRTVMTAELVAEGMGLKGAPVPTDAAIGNESAFIADELEVWRLFSDGEFFRHMGEYLASGTAPGFAPLAEAASRYERYVLSKFDGRLGVFATHDVYIAAYLHAVGVKTDFNRDNWPRFLDAAALFLRPDGTVRRALVRAGLSPLACGV